MAEAYEFLWNELTVDERNEFWHDYYALDVDILDYFDTDEEF